MCHAKGKEKDASDEEFGGCDGVISFFSSFGFLGLGICSIASEEI